MMMETIEGKKAQEMTRARFHPCFRACRIASVVMTSNEYDVVRVLEKVRLDIFPSQIKEIAQRDKEMMKL